MDNIVYFAFLASDPASSLGQQHPEEPHAYRTIFQRDRERILHSNSFRRLKHKTQVFVAQEGDHYRTRLTHSLEVAQIARSISRNLGLNEDLTEALSLAHDLGHTPFGHAGEDALDEISQAFGGFDHNTQTLRLVTKLENRYADFDGLNLSFECLEGLLKHNGPIYNEQGNPTGRYRDKGVPEGLKSFAALPQLSADKNPPLEAQIAALADDIAYNAHDIDDGLRAGLFTLVDIADIPIIGGLLEQVVSRYPDLERPRLSHELLRRLISSMIEDVLTQSRKNIVKSGVKSLEDVRNHPEFLIQFSINMRQRDIELKSFLKRNMYTHTKVLTIMSRAQSIIHTLFKAYQNDITLIPEVWRPEEGKQHTKKGARQIADFIAGMTDVYARDQHKALFDLKPLFS